MSEKLTERTVTLKSNVVNPFEDWADWFGTDSEAIVTFQTMPFTLWERWESGCIIWEHSEECDHGDGVDGLEEKINCDKKRRVVTPENFNADEVRDPGIRRTETNLDTLVDKGLVEKGEKDRRTNSYTLTRHGKREIQDRREWENQYVDEAVPA